MYANYTPFHTSCIFFSKNRLKVWNDSTAEMQCSSLNSEYYRGISNKAIHWECNKYPRKVVAQLIIFH